jgi:hypothetical protein
MNETPEERSIRTGRNAFFGCWALVWAITVLPLFLLGAGFAGGFWPALRSMTQEAVRGNPGSLFILLASLPLLAVPYWLWTMVRDRGRRGGR